MKRSPLKRTRIKPRGKQSLRVKELTELQAEKLDRAHDWLSDRANVGFSGRIRLLQHWANEVIGPRTSSRYNFDRTKSKIKLSRCACCCNNDAVHRHHIIGLNNGGPNHPKNIVGLCESCHCLVHPHMRQSKRKRGCYGKQ